MSTTQDIKDITGKTIPKELQMAQVNDVQFVRVAPTEEAMKLPAAEREKILNDVAVNAQKILAQFKGLNLPTNTAEKLGDTTKNSATEQALHEVELTIHRLRDEVKDSIQTIRNDVAHMLGDALTQKQKWAEQVSESRKTPSSPSLA